MSMAAGATVPLGRLTVLTWLSSDFAVLNILAPASELENRAGSCGRRKLELLKKRGDGGWVLLWEGPGKLKWFKTCLRYGSNFARFEQGSEAEVTGALSRKCRFLELGGV